MLELRRELGIVLSVVHFNHKLRGAESDSDQEFVAGLARSHDLEFYVDGDDVALHAAEERVSVEAAARELRYGFFGHLLEAGAEAPVLMEAENRSGESPAPGLPRGLKPHSDESTLRGPEGPLFHGAAEVHGAAEDVLFPRPSVPRTGVLNKIATGHTLDDQAETVLMRMIRGSGLTGLGGIHSRLVVEGDDGEICGEIVRPLIGVRRRDLEQYLRDTGQSWREDSSNTDSAFTRNRLRKLVVPLLEKEFNPAVAENLAELAEIARGEEEYWENEAAGWMGTTVHWSEPEWARAGSKTSALVQISSASRGESQSPHPHPHPHPHPSTSTSSGQVFSQNRGEMEHPGDDDLELRIDEAPWLVMNASVSRMWLLGEPVAVQRRLVKAIGEQARIPLEFKHVEEILRFAAEDGEAGKELSLPLRWKAVREAEDLIFLTPDLRAPSLQAQKLTDPDLGDERRADDY